jgi:hypothetical protein
LVENASAVVMLLLVVLVRLAPFQVIFVSVPNIAGPETNAHDAVGGTTIANARPAAVFVTVMVCVQVLTFPLTSVIVQTTFVGPPK